ncbi:MAG: hypothetical protein ABJA02_08305 [Acidobacteriota bacterium]
MEITRTAKPARNLANVTVWHCAGCGVMHMSVGKTVVSFTRDEFADFTESVVDIDCSGWTAVSGEHSIVGLVVWDDGSNGLGAVN